VSVLRDQMEALKRDCEDRIGAIERSARAELKELQDTASALRTELEKLHGR
jgi:hypothetical protein